MIEVFVIEKNVDRVSNRERNSFWFFSIFRICCVLGYIVFNVLIMDDFMFLIEGGVSIFELFLFV